MPDVQFFNRSEIEAERARTAPTVQTPRRAAETAPTVLIERRPQIEPPAPSRLRRALGWGAAYLLAGAIFSLAWYVLLSSAPFGIAP